MRTLPLSEVKAKLSGLVEAVERRDEEVMITRNGRPAAVLVSADEYESWKETREIMADKAFMRDIRAGLRAAKRGTLRRYTLDELFGK